MQSDNQILLIVRMDFQIGNRQSEIKRWSGR
jgi:hypothetical protein